MELAKIRHHSFEPLDGPSSQMPVIGGEESNEEIKAEMALMEQVGWEVAAWLTLEGWPVIEQRAEWERPNWGGATVVLSVLTETKSGIDSLEDGPISQRPFRYE